jgi:hypothetical protein
VTVYVIREGRLVAKASVRAAVADRRAIFPTPALSRFEAMESPVTGQTISSWRERDRDMDAAGAVDPRDLPRRPFEERRKANERSKQQPAQWGGITPNDT